MPRTKKPTLPLSFMRDWGIPIPEARQRKYKPKAPMKHTMPGLGPEQLKALEKQPALVRLVQFALGEGLMSGQLGTQSHQIEFPAKGETLFYRRDKPETTLTVFDEGERAAFVFEGKLEDLHEMFRGLTLDQKLDVQAK